MAIDKTFNKIENIEIKININIQNTSNSKWYPIETFINAKMITSDNISHRVFDNDFLGNGTNSKLETKQCVNFLKNYNNLNTVLFNKIKQFYTNINEDPEN